MDGQQRLTSMYRSLYGKDAVATTNDKRVAISRLYYLDMNACLDPEADRYDAIVSVPEDRRIKENFDRDVKLDLSTRELEYEHEMYPANILFDSSAATQWLLGYMAFHQSSPDAIAKFNKFQQDVIETITSYRLPVITMDKSTPREAVCKVFENVNTGGVSSPYSSSLLPLLPHTSLTSGAIGKPISAESMRSTRTFAPTLRKAWTKPRS